ncbi:insulinase family protein [Patescibacteria group bacterium]|nr:insulinase family protein [Patescibacteria group bacterium]MBU1563514.1 insulinase family protein [Patescibacteria group bacterium]MBU2068435.1 insulinase family protein [Patescibacteria group bacterium]
MANNYKKTTLKNGLRIITVPDKNTKTAAVLVLVGTGSKYETKDINGISHFLEHMFFKGTKKYPSTLKLIEPLDQIGGEYNAFTGEEYTGYWAKIDASHLDLALDWVSDIYLNSKFEEKEINREKGTILQEMNMYLDTPMSHIVFLWSHLLYGDQPAGRSVLGTKKIIQDIKRNQFIDYLQNHYSAKNTVIAVAGNVNQKIVINKIKKYFTLINDQKVETKESVKERQTKPEILVNYKKTDQTHLRLGVRAYNMFHPDRYALSILGTILGGYMSSRLFISVRERQGLAYYISAGADMDTDTGVLVASAGVDNQKVDRAIETILNEFKKISEKKVSQKELQKAKDHIKGSTLIGMEASDAKASFYASQELLTNEILTLEEKLGKINKVTINDIQRVAKDIFKPEKLNLALIGPFKDKNKFDKLLKI